MYADEPAQATTMKAIVREKYGSPDVLELRNIEKPVIDDDSVLVRVRAASLNAYDWHMMRGAPYLVRMVAGLRKPKSNAMGRDMAGQVEAVGKNVTEFRPGDEVFGSGPAALAEYVRGKSFLVHKPAGLTFEEAAAVPMAASTALQGLRDRGQIQAGQRVLINGASGGVGTFAVQIAKALGAHVTAVCSTRNVEQARSLGADEVIDYTREDFTRSGRRWDLILDVASSGSLSSRRRVLEPNGILVGVGAANGGGGTAAIMAGLVETAVMSRFGNQKMPFFLATNSKEDLMVLKELIEAGKVRPVVERTYPLSETAAAIRYLEEGHARGKIVITV